MRIGIVVESYWGNTAQVAEAIAAGARQTGAQTVVWSAAQAPAQIADVDLLLVGAPTHHLKLPSSSSRRIAARRGIDVDSSGVREWIASADLSGVPSVFTFDTRVSLHSGSAAKDAAKKLKRRGAHVEQGEGFFITGDTPVLQAGEIERAKEWGSRLAC